MLIGLHYEAIMELLSYCPVPILCGANRLGKTKSSKAALHLIGSIGNFYSSVKERFIPKLCSRSTLPPVFDDVKIPKMVENIAVSFYNMGACLEEYLPRTCPMVTVNWKTLDGLERDPRYVRLFHNFTFRWNSD